MPPIEAWAYDRKMAVQPEMHIMALRCGQAIKVIDLTSHLASIAAPTLVIFGPQDKVVPVSEGYVARENILNCQMVVFDECGHFPMFEKTAQYVDVVQKFLS